MLVLKSTALASAALFGYLVLLAFRPVPAPTDENTYWVEGVVVSAGSPCCEDIVVRLADDTHDYYINRGMERLPAPEDFCGDLRGRTVRIRVIRHWTPLDPRGRLKSIATVEVDGKGWFDASGS